MFNWLSTLQTAIEQETQATVQITEPAPEPDGAYNGETRTVTLTPGDDAGDTLLVTIHEYAHAGSHDLYESESTDSDDLLSDRTHIEAIAEATAWLATPILCRHFGIPAPPVPDDVQTQLAHHPDLNFALVDLVRIEHLAETLACQLIEAITGTTPVFE